MSLRPTETLPNDSTPSVSSNPQSIFNQQNKSRRDPQSVHPRGGYSLVGSWHSASSPRLNGK